MPEIVALPRRPAAGSASTGDADPVVGIHRLRAAGLVRRASEDGRPAGVDRTLPVPAGLGGLFPAGGLRRGSTVAVHGSGSPGATSLLLALVGTASAAGSWCAVVGRPDLGLAAAAEAGVALERFALVPSPGPDWTAVVAALLDGLDIVAVATPGAVPAPIRVRLAARARQRGSVLVPFGQWGGADLVLTPVGGEWYGLGEGRGRLARRELTVAASGRGAAAQARRAVLARPPAKAPAAKEPAAGELAAAPAWQEAV